MQRDLLDALRCPAPHEESWLVAMVHRADGATLIEADLACPVCGAEYAVTQGEAWFHAAQDRVPSTMPANASTTPLPDVERLAAQLGVMGGLAPVLLAGGYAAVAADYAALTGAPVVAVPTASASASAPLAIRAVDVSVLHVGLQLPLGASTLAAAACGVAHLVPDDAARLLASIARAVRAGGRIVAPVSQELPAVLMGTVRTLARDEREWVAEMTATSSGLVALRRSPPPV